MRLYTLQSSTNVAQKRDYLHELDSKIESLINYIDITNPNWQIVNQQYTIDADSTLISTKDLLNYGIIKLAWINNKMHTCLSINKLKLHKGLINKYGTDSYYWLLNEKSFSGQIIKGTIEELQQQEQDLPNGLITSLIEWCKHFFSNYGKFEFSIYVFNINDSYVKLSSSDNTLSDIYLYNNNSVLLATLTNGTFNFYSNKPQVLNTSYLIPAQEGCVIFCNYLNENITTSTDDPNRNILSSYKIFSMASASDLYLPTYYTINDKEILWHWDYFESATEKMGTNIIFHLPLPPHRLYIHNIDNTYCLKPLTINDLIHTHTEISMFINNQTIIPNIASYDGIVWNSVDNNNILSKIYHATDTESGIDLEEVFFDQEISINTLNIENYQTSNYNITIKHNIVPTFLKLYLNIM